MINIYSLSHDFENKNIFFYHTPRTGGNFFINKICEILNNNKILISNFYKIINDNIKIKKK